MNPDLISLRQSDDKMVVDILDPHDPTRADAVLKAKGLAWYAERHSARFGRTQVIQGWGATAQVGAHRPEGEEGPRGGGDFGSPGPRVRDHRSVSCGTFRRW